MVNSPRLRRAYQSHHPCQKRLLKFRLLRLPSPEQLTSRRNPRLCPSKHSHLLSGTSTAIINTKPKAFFTLFAMIAIRLSGMTNESPSISSSSSWPWPQGFYASIRSSLGKASSNCETVRAAHLRPHLLRRVFQQNNTTKICGKVHDILVDKLWEFRASFLWDFTHLHI